MVSFTTICFTVAATAVASVNAFTNPCRFPYDNCGWVLASTPYGISLPQTRSNVLLCNPSDKLTGYTYNELQAAANSTDGSMIYDALYSCDSETGAISYAGWCGGGGKCETGVVPNDNCRS
jgi:hypothetical protein